MARRKARAKDVVLGLVAVAGIACAVVGGAIIAQDERGLDQYSELAKEAVAQAPTDASAAGEEGPDVDWDELRDINEDVCGWLSVDGTEISLPVVQASEEWPDKYLYYSFYGDRSQIGCPYLNWQCDPDGRVMTIYGHHVWYSGRMFNELGDAYTEEKFSQLGDAWWCTPAQGARRFRLLGSAYIDMWEGDEWNPTSFGSSAEVRSWLAGILGDLDQTSPEAGDLAGSATRVLVLATCTDSGIKSKRCVTVFASADEDWADKVLQVTWDGIAAKAIAGSSTGLAERLRGMGAAEEISTCADGGVSVKVTEQQLDALASAAEERASDMLASLKATYPECSFSSVTNGLLEAYVPESDEASWDGIASRLGDCLLSQALAATLGQAKSGKLTPSVDGSEAVVWNKATARLVSTWKVGEPGRWTAPDWEKSRS